MEGLEVALVVDGALAIEDALPVEPLREALSWSLNVMSAYSDGMRKASPGWRTTLEAAAEERIDNDGGVIGREGEMEGLGDRTPAMGVTAFGWMPLTLPLL